VEGLGLAWSEEEVLSQVDSHPERFSANVILRGVFQEMILPNIAFIGGGGEIAYWLELKKVFDACSVPYPLLIVRNSFLLVNEPAKQKADKLGFTVKDLFKPTHQLTSELVKRESELQLQLTKEKNQLTAYYKHLEQITSHIDSTLTEHVKALYANASKKINTLEKKMLRAETKKFEAQQRQVSKLKALLFPNDNLQERVDNFSVFYAEYGENWLRELYEASLTLEQKLCIVTMKP
jgi:uncharacterized protein YllA (UPF0747 family)